MVNFADIAKKKMADIERPPLPPVGHYDWQIIKLPEVTKSSDEKWEFVIFPIRAVQAGDDVDPDELKSIGGVEKVVMSHRFVINTEDAVEADKTAFAIRRFLVDHVKCADEDMSVAEAINACVNGRFKANVVWKADKQDPELFHANIGRTAPVD